MQVGARVTRLGRSSLTMQHRVASETQDALVAEGESVVVLYDYRQHRSTPIDQPLRQQIAALEGRPL